MVRELLRQTDPRRARFLDARSGYVAIPAAFGPLTGVFSHDVAATKELGPATFDCLADILGAAGVRVARAHLTARAEDALASTLAFYGDKMAGGAAAVVARVVAAAGPRSSPLASSVRDANDAGTPRSPRRRGFSRRRRSSRRCARVRRRRARVARVARPGVVAGGEAAGIRARRAARARGGGDAFSRASRTENGRDRL